MRQSIIEIDHADDMLDEASVETRVLRVDADGHGQRLDRWLAQVMPGLSRSYWQTGIEQGHVSVDGLPVTKCARRLAAGQTVTVQLHPVPQAQAYAPQPMPLSVVHEDDHLLVLDKPAGLVVHPGAGHWSGTLLNGLLAYHPGAAGLPRAGIVHRLDKDTSGLMVVAKSPHAYETLVAAIAARQVQRLYVALAWGAWRRPAQCTVEAPIGRDPRQRLRMAVLACGGAGARAARTDLRVLDGHASMTLLACRLHTGRTHQIRVHLAWLGHPLVGDALYGGRAFDGLSRQALHAAQLGLRHPVTGAWQVWRSALPHDLAQALQRSGLHYNAALLDEHEPGGASGDRAWI
ncbi:Ribosomal large subunit pseudouridine synthase D [Tepidimonas alkaliphilus]|uniref:Pseudouridine synthase n=1 Tax=Tepidimonas alkaliphilus TaxID=2588942 RepID=A0A554WD95_9BURK|nr:RluA family pseudouridine synthase [Tepidimonas alkaliphilus]TSE21560.1 Ribosomal large subunit pseudouridine synthase D [Tepidimonas alkaliphilus]